MKRKSPAYSLIVCAVLGLMSAHVMQAADDASAGVIEGRVLNSAKGEYVGNARLTVEGTLLETFTQSDGSYRLTNVPAGTATVKTFFTGLPAKTISVRVAAGMT